MRSELSPANGVGPGRPGCQHGQAIRQLENRQREALFSKRLAQPVVIVNAKNPVDGRPAQVGINHEHSAGVGMR